MVAVTSSVSLHRRNQRLTIISSCMRPGTNVDLVHTHCCFVCVLFVRRRHSFGNLLADVGAPRIACLAWVGTNHRRKCLLPRVQVYQAFESQFSKSMDAEIAKEAR